AVREARAAFLERSTDGGRAGGGVDERLACAFAARARGRGARHGRRMKLTLPVVATLALLAVRLYAAHRIGFGDSEALYACYARHPQPVYLDHPGLIGVFARLLGGGDTPTPLAAHLGTAVLATAAPWTAALAARISGATWTASGLAAGALMLAPE